MSQCACRWEQWDSKTATPFPRQAAPALGWRGLGRVGTVFKSPNACVCVCVRARVRGKKNSDLAHTAVIKTIPTLPKERRAIAGAAWRGKGVSIFESHCSQGAV